ncbi:MAG: M16 family metallopeptidase, partial [Rickettsiales bacterium]
MSGLYQETTLPNGLRVATEKLPGAHSVAVAVSVNVGARYEAQEQNGLSHLLEHMAFKGTKTRTARQIAESFDDVGAHLNAFTSSEHTVYYARTLPKDLPMAVEVLADILLNATFEAEELERERGVILQEIAMHQDTPDDLAFDHFHETVYPNQPLGRSILGTPEHIKAFTADDLRAYVAQYYCPASMVITAAGAVEHEQLVQWVGEHFTYTDKGLHPKPAPARYVGGDKRVKADFEQMHLVLGIPGLSYNDPDYYIAQMVTTVLGGGMSSRLFQEVREKRGLAYSVYGFLSAYADGGMLGMYAAAAESAASKLAEVLVDEVLSLADNGVSESEISRACQQHIAGLQMMHENVSSVAEWMGRHL